MISSVSGKIFWPLFFFLILTSCNWRPGIERRPVLRVNESNLGTEEFAQLLADEVRHYDSLSLKDPQILHLAKKKIIDDFIVQCLTKAYAQKNQILVRKEDLDAKIKSLSKSYPDEFSFKTALAEEGLSFDRWREKLSYSILERLVHDQISKTRPEPTETAIKDYFEEHREQFSQAEGVKLRQILLKTQADADKILEELKKGKKMKELAPKYSASPEGATGGDLGWVSRGVSEIFDRGFAMRPGDRSPILKSDFGYHIFEVIELRKAKSAELAEVRGLIKKLLIEEEEKKRFAQWLEQQLKSSHIFKDENLINAVGVQTRNE